MRKILMATAAAALIPAVPAAAQDLVIRNVTVIDPETASRQEGRDVLIDEGRILSVSAASEAVADRIIDGSGLYLMPGLMDMHSHSSFTMVHQQSLRLMHANGITGVREMGSDCTGGPSMCLDQIRVSQDLIEKGEMIGPRLLELSTSKVNSNRPDEPDELEALYHPTTPEQARASVAGLIARGPDILKVSQEFMPDAFRAFLDEAQQRGIKVGGHIPMTFSVAEVAVMGMTSIEHARDLPLDCSASGAPYRAQIAARLAGEAEEWPDRSKMAGNARDTFDETICAGQIQAMIDHGTYYVPTHLTREMDYRAVDPSYRADPRLKYIPPFQQRFWDRDLDRTASAPPELIKDLDDFFQLGLKTTGMAHRAGVRIMAGTDANDTMVFPGFSLHDELKHLVAAGLSPMAALQAATSVPADYLGRRADFGGVSAGKLADLVLLSADPTMDIDNSDAIVAVIQGGRVSDRAALDALLDEVAADYAAAAPARQEEEE